jgi:hypothetical protein
MKKLLLAGVAIATLVSLAHAAEYGPDDIGRAIETGKQNEIRFTRDFANRTIGFVWTFDHATSSFGGGYNVEFGNGGMFGNVICEVSEQSTLNRVVEWNKGQRASVTGIIDRASFGDLYLRNCKIEAVQEEHGS